MKMVPAGVALVCAAGIAAAQDLAGAHGFRTGQGDKAELTVILDADCAPCLRAYTEIVSRQAISDPLLLDRPGRWIPLGRSEHGLHAAARALQRKSMDGFASPVTVAPMHFYIEQAKANTRLLHTSGTPMFILSNQPYKAGYSNWSDFSSWLLP